MSKDEVVCLYTDAVWLYLNRHGTKYRGDLRGSSLGLHSSVYSMKRHAVHRKDDEEALIQLVAGIRQLK